MTGDSKDRMTGDALVPEPYERPWDQSNCARAVADVFRGAGLAWATPHSLRRTVATVIHANNVPLNVIADVLGHGNPSMTARVYGRDPFAERPNVAQYLVAGN